MRKITFLLPFLSVALAVTPTTNEQSDISYATIYLKGALNAIDDQDYERAIRDATSCVNDFSSIIKKNPALTAALVPGVDPETTTVQDAINECNDIKTKYAVMGSDEFYRARENLSSMRRGVDDDSLYYTGVSGADRVAKLQECVQLVTDSIKAFPVIVDVSIGEGLTPRKLGDYCKARLVTEQKKVNQANAAAVSKVQNIVARYQKAEQTFQKVLARSEKTNGDILGKYKELKVAQEAFEGMNSTIRDNSSIPANTKLGNTTFGQLSQNVSASYRKATAALQQIKPRVDRAFDAQDTQVKATMLKITAGERLAVFKRHGIPSNWAGGPVFSKNGVYSGDGVAVAKDIASATQWYYNDNGRGCDYKYFFSKNSVVKVEKPLGC